jgi:O-antigen ligase
VGDRIEAWYEGIQMLKSSPLLGVGYGNFLDHHHLTAHNSFVLCFAELGLVGYFFWMGLIVLVYRGLGKVIAEGAAEADERKLAILLRSSVVGFLTCAWFLSRTYQPTLYLLLGLATATWFCWAKQAGSKREYAQRGRLPWALPALGMMVITIIAVQGFIVM